jgi:hypothetical protein
MKKELWLRLRHYHFTDLAPAHLQERVLAMFGTADASTLAFASKLTRKLGWPRPFALRAIEEYKKFVYLGLVSPFPVTPPKIIDQVWHEHLLFSRGYREFCRDVLQRDFDHNPELVPTDEQTQAFQQQYQATLELYESEFNVVPPKAIWGVPKFDTASMASSRKPKVVDRRSTTHSDDTPLYVYFSGAGSDGGASYDSMTEFGGGGGFSGGGGDSSWGDSSDSSGGADSGGSDGGGSGCSSGCGGGGD